jgi:hypothetical protein
MSTCTALIIPANPNEAARIKTIDAGLETLQNFVGGSIEAVSGEDWHFYLNEEGKILHLRPNRRAAFLVLHVTGVLTDVYCGDIVLLGETPDGGEGNVSAALIQQAAELFDVAQLVD